MKRNMYYKIGAAVLLIVLLLLTGACSEISLFTLLVNEREGDFKMSQDVVNVSYGETYQVKAQGGFLPYSYETASVYGTLDPLTGEYTAPQTGSGDEEVEIMSSDRFDSSDTMKIRLYTHLEATLTSFTIRMGETQNFDVSGGYIVTAYTVTAVYGTIIPVDSDTYTYDPASTGMDYIEITDEINNSISITVQVLSAGELGITPTYAVITPGGTQPFEVSGGTGIFPGDFTIELSDPGFGSISNDGIDTITYNAPASEGAVILSVTDDIGTTVTADIYITGETPVTLTLSPSYVEASPGAILEFTAAGGIPPYTFSILNGAGSLEKISPTTMRIETSSPPPAAKIRVEDAVGNTATANIDLKEK